MVASSRSWRSRLAPLGPSGPPRRRSMLYLIYGVDGPDGARIRAATRDAHFAYLERHRDILVLGGATLADDGIARTGSVLIINVASREEADAFARDEPFHKAR